jgi:hypothetical protein
MHIKIAVMLAISLLQLLDKIDLKIVMHIGISNRMIGVLKSTQSSLLTRVLSSHRRTSPNLGHCYRVINGNR